jgi:hypothetical protein
LIARADLHNDVFLIVTSMGPKCLILFQEEQGHPAHSDE